MERASERWREDWALAPVEEGDIPPAIDIASEIMDIMEQGILLWSAAGVCELHNARVYEVLELEPGELTVGTTREAFEAALTLRGCLAEEDLQPTAEAVAQNLPYGYDVNLVSGRVVLARGRPSAAGGYVVTFTDVTEARRATRDLKSAREEAEAAESRARDILESEHARQREARLLSQLDEWLQSCKTLTELYMIVTKFMGRVMTGTEGEIYTYSNSRDVLDGVGSWSTDSLQSHIPPDSCWSLRRGRAYEYHPEEICFVCHHLDHPPDEEYHCEYVCVPVVAHGDTVGLVHVRFDGSVWSGHKLKDAMRFTVQCAEHISMAIANVKLRDELHDQSVRDPLTGLYNRRFFMDAMRREIAIADRRRSAFGLISFDADKFKAFNDNHGHDAGDAVLRALAGTTGEVFTSGELSCRVGGEEFAIVLPGCDLAQTHVAAERLRVAVSELQVRYVNGILPRVTISAGIAAYPESADDPQTLLKRADNELYRAKDDGRNRVRGLEAGDAASAPGSAPPIGPAAPGAEDGFGETGAGPAPGPEGWPPPPRAAADTAMEGAGRGPDPKTSREPEPGTANRPRPGPNTRPGPGAPAASQTAGESGTARGDGAPPQTPGARRPEGAPAARPGLEAEASGGAGPGAAGPKGPEAGRVAAPQTQGPETPQSPPPNGATGGAHRGATGPSGGPSASPPPRPLPEAAASGPARAGPPAGPSPGPGGTAGAQPRAGGAPAGAPTAPRPAAPGSGSDSQSGAGPGGAAAARAQAGPPAQPAAGSAEPSAAGPPAQPAAAGDPPRGGPPVTGPAPQGPGPAGPGR